MKPENTFDDFTPIDSEEDLVADEAELKRLKKELVDITFWASSDRASGDENLINELEAKIAELEKKIAEVEPLTRAEFLPQYTQESIDKGFEDLFVSIKAEGEIQGSSRKYTAEELIERINEVRKLFKEGKGVSFDLNMITNTNKIRDKVRDLIEKETVISGKK